MEKIELIKGLKYLGIAFGKEYDEEECQVYYDFLKEYPMETFSRAVKNLIPKSTFVPKLNEIMKEMAEITTPQLKLNPYSEWEKVLKAVRKYGTYGEEKALASLEEPTSTIVRQMGWYNICTSEAIEWKRKRFEEMFEYYNDDLQKDLVTNSKQIGLEELKRLAQEQAKREDLDYLE